MLFKPRGVILPRYGCRLNYPLNVLTRVATNLRMLQRKFIRMSPKRLLTEHKAETLPSATAFIG